MCHSSVPPRYFGIGKHDGYEYELSSNTANGYSSIVNCNNNKTSYTHQNKRSFMQSENTRELLDRHFHLGEDIYRFSDSD